MFNGWRLPLISAAFLAWSFSIGATSFLVKSEPVAAQQAQQKFPDVPPNYWARPFIQSLAEKGIVTGYLDRTFRPKQAVDRDEFAAMIRQAFDRAKIRNISNASGFNDVPQGYWAEPPIQEAYYKDADKIPKDAVDEVAAATKANIPVNYPDPRLLNPTELLSRGSATALIHQALVYQGQIEPLSNNEEATKYLPASAAKKNN